MNTKKKAKKIDLLEVPDSERAKIISELKQSLRQTIVEAKLWSTFLKCESVTINGRVVLSSDNPLEGFSVPVQLGQF